MEAAITAYAETKPFLTMMNIHQKPGEGNYDRIEEISMKAALLAAEAVQRRNVPRISIDEQDTIVMETIGEDEGG